MSAFVDWVNRMPRRKRVAVGLGIVLPLLVLGGLAAAFAYAIGLVRFETRVTRELATPDAKRWFMDARTTPEEMGFATYTELAYTSDGLKLSGWWFPATDTVSDKTLLLVHGRWSNRYRFISPLDIVQRAGLNRQVNVFLPDLRNSGTSDIAEVGLGQLFARDIEHTLAFLHHEKAQNEFAIWGQSQGAMASLIFAGRPSHQAARAAAGYELKALFLESPLANSTENALDKARKDGFPVWFVRAALGLYDTWYADDFLDSMDFSVLVPRSEAPILVCQTEIDSTTPSPILKAELEQVGTNPSNLHVEWFAQGDHARICFPEANRARFAALLQSHLGRAFGLPAAADTAPRPVPAPAAAHAPVGSSAQKTPAE